VDYRKLNQVTKTDYPIPRVDDLIDNVSNAKFVTKIDLLTAYFQIPLTERAQELLSFVTPDGLYKFKVIPYRCSTLVPKAYKFYYSGHS
jgi:hypothetical protein